MGFFKQSIVFMGVEKSIFARLKISKNKPQNIVDFSDEIELVEEFFKLFVNKVGI